MKDSRTSFNAAESKRPSSDILGSIRFLRAWFATIADMNTHKIIPPPQRDAR